MSAIEKRSAVLRVDQSPMNPRRWCLELSCGHEEWVTATKRPTKRYVKCGKCLDAARYVTGALPQRSTQDDCR